ncbi:DUF5018-related domain-containing protein [Capnocytophaga felis]|uniref:DUF5018 domain-containing protein n=1 Tax=Capnocytophaga felis TaxID=2267611 RepID=A0A5M4B990_9FLAO|nr:hypothetical protein [Capnocytophaga felis]GET45960.1 hypothetical protein RCZ01_12620 [Capnocytophaga felis]GET49188.1 hypothetical protein RCZ02_20190 [Capnocytophaga felis]
MRKYIHFLLAVLVTGVISCQKEEGSSKYEESNIVALQGVEYHYVFEQTSDSGTQKVVKYINLVIDKSDINKETKAITIEVTVPASNKSFPEEERAKVSLKNLAVAVGVSTAAKVYPIGEAPKLGIPADWSKPSKYRVEADNGNSSEWTIEVTSFKK